MLKVWQASKSSLEQQAPTTSTLHAFSAAPKQLCVIAEVAAEKIKQISAADKIDKLASIELKGALIAPSIACNLNMPCVIVRKEEKAYGVTGRIAGADVTKGDNILFFDDVISEGLSKVEGIKPLAGTWRQRQAHVGCG